MSDKELNTHGKATVYIRVPNRPKWSAIKDKSEWVNRKLEGVEVPPEFWQTQTIAPMIYDPKLGRMVPKE